MESYRLIASVAGTPKVLELKRDTKLSFTKKNSIFAFAELEASRSVSFNIPATEVNEQVFQLAKDPAYTGSAMRMRIAVQLQYNGGVLDGYIYATEATNKEYKCCFVFGELLNLRALQSVTDIKDVYPSNIVNYADYIIDYLSNGALMYPQQLHTLLPSVSLAEVIHTILSSMGMGDNFPTPIGAADNVYTIVKPNVLYPLSDYLNYEYGIAGVQTSGSSYIYDSADFPDYTVNRWFCVLGSPDSDYPITFADDFPDDFCLFITNGTPGGTADEPYVGTSDFLGGYFPYDDGQGGIVAVGTPLKGKTVNLQRGTYRTGLGYSGPTYRIGRLSEFTYIGGNVLQYHPNAGISLIYKIYIGDQAPFEDYSRMPTEFDIKDVLPDWSLMQLLQNYAYMRGEVIRWDNNTIYFDDLTSGWGSLVLSNVLSEETMSRKVQGAAQRNIVNFESGDDVSASAGSSYDISNTILESDKVVYTISASEANKAPIGDKLLVTDVELDSGVQKVAYIPPVVGILDNNMLIWRHIPLNNTLNNMYSKSTYLKLRVGMSLYEYTQLKEKTYIYYKGIRYVWVSSQWSGGVTTLDLQKC